MNKNIQDELNEINDKAISNLIRFLVEKGKEDDNKNLYDDLRLFDLSFNGLESVLKNNFGLSVSEFLTENNDRFILTFKIMK